MQKLKYRAKKSREFLILMIHLLKPLDMPESIRQVFKSLKEKGILTGIASGRTPYGIVPEIKALQPDYFAMINGSYVEKCQRASGLPSTNVF